jgi:hypothetical protein
MVAIAFETKQQLAIGDFLHLRCTGAKRRFQILFPKVVGLAHVAVNIDYSHSVF